MLQMEMEEKANRRATSTTVCSNTATRRRKITAANLLTKKTRLTYFKYFSEL